MANEVDYFEEWEAAYEDEIKASEEAMLELEAEKHQNDNMEVADDGEQEVALAQETPPTSTFLQENEAEDVQMEPDLPCPISSRPALDDPRLFLHDLPSNNNEFTCTLANGERYFLREHHRARQTQHSSISQKNVESLLMEPVSRLLARLEKVSCEKNIL